MSALAIERRLLHEDAFSVLRQTTRRTAIVAPVGAGKTTLVNRIAEARDDVVAVRVADSVDLVERTILDLGATLGDNARDQAAGELSRHLDDPEPALSVLDNALNGRRLVVDDFGVVHHKPGGSELSDLLAPSRRKLAKWLSSRALLLATPTPPPAHWKFDSLMLSDQRSAPWDVNPSEPRAATLWRDVQYEKESYRVALSHWALFGTPPQFVFWDVAEQIKTVWDAVPDSVHDVMALLATYGAMFPAAQFERLIREVHENTTWALDYARSSLLVERSRDGYWLSPTWQSWVPRLLEGRAKRSPHHILAKFFARLVREGNPGDPRWIQAAHRHFIRSGDFKRAGDFIRYGVGLLLDAGRDASLHCRYGEAEQYYALVLHLDERITTDGATTGVGLRNRGYARHYFHYNRYKDEREAIDDTERGYRRSVQEYRENALFWSRLIVARFELGAWDSAMQAQSEAASAVDSESARQKYLLGRTVNKLLERGHDNAALIIWGDTSEISEPKAFDARHRLIERGRLGWSTDHIRVPGRPDTVFNRSVGLVFKAVGDGRYRCRIRDCRVDGTGQSHLAALRDVVERLRSEALTLLQTSPDRLDAAQRMRKRELLGLINVPASEIRGPGASFQWITGRIVEAGNSYAFIPLTASEGERYELHASVVLTGRPEGLVDAKVQAGRGGLPQGPVIEIVDLFADRAALDEATTLLDKLLGG